MQPVFRHAAILQKVNALFPLLSDDPACGSLRDIAADFSYLAQILTTHFDLFHNVDIAEIAFLPVDADDVCIIRYINNGFHRGHLLVFAA
jgi:hypothetical protein